MTVSPVIGLEDAPEFLRGSRTPETLFDLFSMFPELDGVNQTIYVERKDPKTYAGRKVAGMMRPITHPITLAEWQEIYGGGTYKLIVYGTPKRGGTMNRDGRMNQVKLSEPITVTFPGIPSGNAEVYYDEDEAMNADIASRSRGPASIADANIVKEQIQADLKREERQENREKSKEDKLEEERLKREREQSAIFTQMATLSTKMVEQQAEFRREQIEAERAHQREIRDRDEKWASQLAALTEKFSEKDPGSDQLRTALEISKSLNGDGKASAVTLEALRADHARETDRLQQQLKEERTRSDARIKEAEERADARIKEFEQRTLNTERDLRERADREVARTKEEADRRINDLQHQHTMAVNAESKNHERDKASLIAQHQMLLESQKGSYEMRLETARGEVKRTQSDVERFRQEAESNKDVVGKLKKLKEDAAELGMVEAADNAPEPQTLPQMLMQMGSNVFQQLPQIVESVSSMVKQRSAQELEAARAQGREEMVTAAAGAFPGLPPAHRRRSGGSDFGGDFVPRHMSEVGPAPAAPWHDPSVVMPQPQQFEPAPAPMPMPQQYAPPMPVAAFPPGHTGMPPEPQMAPARPQLQPMASAPPPAPSPSTPPPAPAPAPQDPALLAEDRQILNAETMLRPHYDAGAPPSVIAEAMLQNFGPEEVKKTLATLDAERVILAITRAGDPASPFLRRDGKKYLRAVFAELKKKVA